MGKSAPKAPAAPDPVATANAQAAANKDAAITQAGLNRINQVTPWGSLTYSQNGVDANGIPQYTQTQTYSPEQQALYDQQNQIAQQLGTVAQSNIGRVQETQGRDFNFNGMTPLQTQVQSGGLQFGTQNPQAQTQVGNAGNIQRAYDQGGPIQNNLNFSGAPSVNTNFDATSKAAADAAYSQAASRLDPQFQQRESDTRSRLAAQGITENSDAYRREMDNMGRDRADAYNQAQYSAIGAGLQAQQQGFGQSLAARQQSVGETAQQGQFANDAQAQQYMQNQGSANFWNASQDQQYQQMLSNAGFYNQAQSQNFNQAQQSAALNNTAVNQQFNQGLANAQLNNNSRQQQIDEASYLRNLPLNDIAALLGTGGGVQNPQFQNFAQVGVAAPDYQGAVYANYNAQNQQYQNAMANRSAGLGSLFGLAGSIGSAFISDRRFKENIRRVGTLANGLATYVYNYIGSKAVQFGVMAQEALTVVPEAVGELPGGVLYVDYSKVWHGKQV